MNRRLVLYCFKSLKPILEPHRDENTLEETLNRKFDETQTTRMEISNVLQDIYKYIYLPDSGVSKYGRGASTIDLELLEDIYEHDTV